MRDSFFWGRILFLFVGVGLFSSCGYHLDRGPLVGQARQRTITVPYIEGDCNGELTAGLIAALAASGAFTPLPSGGDYLLVGRLKQVERMNIGYQYDRNLATGLRTKRIVPNEGKLMYELVIELKEKEGLVSAPPFCIAADVDYAFNPLSNDNELAVESLGQYVTISAAEEAAFPLVVKELSVKAVDHLLNSW